MSNLYPIQLEIVAYSEEFQDALLRYKDSGEELQDALSWYKAGEYECFQKDSSIYLVVSGGDFDECIVEVSAREISNRAESWYLRQMDNLADSWDYKEGYGG